MREKNKKRKGVALIIVLILNSLIFILGASFISNAAIESKIVKSQSESIKAYYIAESGIQEAIWKVQNDAEWKNNFENDAAWENNIIREDALCAECKYIVSIKNSDLAQAEIISSGTKKVGEDAYAKRAAKTGINKLVEGIDSTEIENLKSSALIVDGDIDVWGLNLKVDGNSFSSGNTDVKLWSIVNVTGSANALGNISKDSSSVFNASLFQSQNNPPVPEPANIPSISFDSAGDAQSLKAKAQALGEVYSAENFKALLESMPDVNLNGIFYVTGNINIKRGTSLTIDGALVSDGSITIGDDWQWWDVCSPSDASLKVNSVSGSPSGIFAKNQISVKMCVKGIEINGVVYAGNSILFSSLSNSFLANGSVITKHLEGTGLWKPVNINFNQEILIDSLAKNNVFSPLINFGHWEEIY